MKSSKVRPGYHLVPIKFGKFDEIPEEWNEKPLDFFLEINMGESPPSNSYNDQKDGITFLQGVMEFGDTYPETRVWCTDPKKVCDSNQILFSVRAPVGEINLSKTKTCIGRGLAALKPKKNYDLKYCYYILQHFSNRFIPYSQGTTYDAINQGDLAKVIFPFTENVSEQQKIGSILSNYDELIQKQERMITQTRRLKEGQSYTLLTKGVGHSNFETVNYGLRWMNEDFPSKWIPTPLGKLCKIRKNSDVSSDTYIGLEHIEEKGSNNLISKGDASLFTSTKTFKKGDVLYGKLRPYLNKIWLATESGHCSTDILPLTVNKKILNTFLIHVLTSKLFLNYAIATSAGTRMPRTEWNDIKKFKVVLPPTIEEQQKIASILSNLVLLIQQERQYKEKLQKIKRGLMQQLLTGQKRVKV